MDKKTLRKTLNSIIMTISSSRRQEKSLNICRAIKNCAEWTEAETVLMYMPMKNEVDIIPLMEKALESGKKCGVPVINNNGQMDFFLIGGLDPENFRMNNYGIREPAEKHLFLPSGNVNTLMIVPGLGFALSGERLGRGGGYYDRYLGKWGKYLRTAGVCFAEQLRKDIPHEKHDYTVNRVFSG